MGQVESEQVSAVADKEPENCKEEEVEKHEDYRKAKSEECNCVDQNKESTSTRTQEKLKLNRVVGFQVVRLMPSSPAHHAGLVPYFDLIVALDGEFLNKPYQSKFSFFKKYMESHVDCVVKLTVFSLHTRTLRDVSCIPNNKWGGEGLLGCSVEWAMASKCVERCWHVVDILYQSPAWHCADLIEEQTYIIGMQQPEESVITLLKSEEDLYNRLDTWHLLQRTALETSELCNKVLVAIPHVLLFLIYDRVENEVKEILVEMGTQPDIPLGVRVASGLLHHIPVAATQAQCELPIMRRFAIRVNEVNEKEVNELEDNRVALTSENKSENENYALPNVHDDEESREATQLGNTKLINQGNNKITLQRPDMTGNESEDDENVSYNNDYNCAENPFLDGMPTESKEFLQHSDNIAILLDVIAPPPPGSTTFPRIPAPLSYPYFFDVRAKPNEQS